MKNQALKYDDVSSESSHMKNQALFSSKDKSKKCRLLLFWFGALKVK